MTSFPEHLIKTLAEVKDENVDYKDLYAKCKKLCQQMTSNDASKLEVPVNNSVDKSILMARVITEAARRGLSSDALKSLLPANNISQAIVAAFKENEEAIRECLASIGWEPPRVVDISWKLSRVLKGDSENNETAVAEIHLDTLPTGSDILWKLKEAQNAVTNIKKCE